ncbi:ranBP2-type zinc finger protein At1g67325 isoform X1 [Amborella trichopoda]|uniref:ranBP2-type zinc finger protein At1g67325 isoform X1 n=1 Tax=Amborella trichopoda TaxID=13333 RepID=UPI0009BCB8E6|nr:ranBP2-type zinc finger protein At1g67325 isoform X1 [Amborella trichopoda]|eukprot:XP_020519247.1 ranBP2-type zinc finger protein At1g67325 isoform X1 [Amborella trichopoda]
MSSAKVDHRGSFGSKRSRNDVSHNDGDWTCPQCGNVNFGFRTVCNRAKCGALRPPTTPRMTSAPIPRAYDPPPFYVGGIGAPPPMPLGMPGSYGPPMPLSGMPFDYGASRSVAGPYGLLSPYGAPPLGGLGYGPGPAMDGYGFGFRGSPLPVPGPWPGDIADTNGSRKRRGGPDGSNEGDWICPKCDNLNFAFRTTCNMKKCGTPKPEKNPAQEKNHCEFLVGRRFRCSGEESV